MLPLLAQDVGNGQTMSQIRITTVALHIACVPMDLLPPSNNAPAPPPTSLAPTLPPDKCFFGDSRSWTNRGDALRFAWYRWWKKGQTTSYIQIAMPDLHLACVPMGMPPLHPRIQCWKCPPGTLSNGKKSQTVALSLTPCNIESRRARGGTPLYELIVRCVRSPFRSAASSCCAV